MFDNNPALTAFGRFPADLGAVAAALAVTREFIANARCGADAEAKLSIIVEELVANIVEHGGCPQGSEIDMDLAAIGADIGLTLTDSGMAFDLRLVVHEGDLPPERGGGAGIALVKSWATIVDYVRHGDKNILTLVIADHG